MSTGTEPHTARLTAYALLAAPLAFALLPIYVHLPAFYARETGLSLTLIGMVLLVTRLLDAIIDPWLGGLIDGWRRRGTSQRRITLLGLPLLALGFVALFHPPASAVALWLTAGLVITYLAFSVSHIAYQGWGSVLAWTPAGRARVTAWREGLGLVGVILASVLPTVLSMSHTSLAFVLLLVVASLVAMAVGPTEPGAKAGPCPATVESTDASTPKPAGQPCWRSWFAPLRNPAFRPLFAVFVINGIATAIPATLVIFFIQDRLQAPAAAGLFLGVYFLAGALGMPGWLWLARRIGQRAAWTASMLMAIAAFAGAATLGAGDITAFAIICAVSGLALGAELALPPAMLSTAIARGGDALQREGAYFGLWTAANKLNLALAAGLALPLLAALGYTPRNPSPEGLVALTVAYTVLPCLLKLVAAALLWFSRVEDAHHV